MIRLPEGLVAVAIVVLIGIVWAALFGELGGGAVPAGPLQATADAPVVAPSTESMGVGGVRQIWSGQGSGQGRASFGQGMEQRVGQGAAMQWAPPLKTPPRAPPPLTTLHGAGIQLAEAHWQGLEAIPLTTEIRKKLKISRDVQGVLIDETTLAAADAGLLAGDVLVAIQGNPVRTLEGVLRETKRVKRLKSVVLTVQRGTSARAGAAAARRQAGLHQVVLTVPDELGFAQVETAPMILSGDIAPHPYRGPCTQCHLIGTTGHMVPDPDLITLPAPPIRAHAPRPHQDRGPCLACHKIIP